jgi:hypothetical protein
MSKRARITGTYRLGEDELIQFTVDLDSSFPAAVAVAEATVLSLLHDELIDVLELNHGHPRTDNTESFDIVWPEDTAE